MRNRLYLTIFVLLMMLTSCYKAPSVILNGNTCKVPCWQSIKLGETTKEEVERKISDMPSVDKQSIKQVNTLIPAMEEEIAWNFQGVKETRGEILFHDQKAILLSFYYTNSVSLQDFIKYFGDPEGIIIQSSNTGDPFIYVTSYMLYPEQGVCLFYESNNLKRSKTYTLDQSTGIKRIFVISGTTADDQRRIGCLRGMDENSYKSLIQKWTGYGEYSLK